MSLNKIPSSEYIYRQFDILNSKIKTLECEIDKLDSSEFSCFTLGSCSTSNLPEGSNLYFTNNRAISALTGQNISIFNNNAGYITNSALAPYLTSATAAATYQPIGSYLTTISGLNISLLNNDSGYITSSALTGYATETYVNSQGFITSSALAPYLTSANAALTYYPLTNPSGYTSNTGTVTSVGGTGTVSGLTLTGTVTTSGNLTLGGTLALTSSDVTTGLGYTPENVANKSTTTTLGTSDTLYPTQNAVKTYVDSQLGKEKTLDLWVGSSTTTNGTETILRTIPITANDVANGDILWISNQISTSQASGNITTRARVGTSPVPANITLETELMNGGGTANTNGFYAPTHQYITFSGGNITTVLRSTLVVGAGVQMFSVAAPPLNATWYIYITSTKNAAGTVTLTSSIIKRDRA